MSAKNLGCALCLKPTSPNERDYTFSLFVAFLLLCVLFCFLFLLLIYFHLTCFILFQLFAAAFPLAPLIALLTNAIDMKIDASRLLWIDRRPVAFRAEDIGQ